MQYLYLKSKKPLSDVFVETELLHINMRRNMCVVTFGIATRNWSPNSLFGLYNYIEFEFGALSR